jgi:hypothetical protein
MSGILSFYPLGKWAKHEPSARDLAAFRGGDLAPEKFSRRLGDALDACRVRLELPIKRVEFVRAGGAPFYLCKAERNASVAVSALAGGDAAAPGRAELAELASHLGHGARVTSQVWLVSGDAYYYPTHFVPDTPLPVLRTHFDDGRQIYVNPKDLTVVRCYPPGARPYRWLYHGLHSWDLPWLYRRPWLWRTSIVTALLLGVALVAIAAWLSVRQLRRAGREPVRARATASTRKLVG